MRKASKILAGILSCAMLITSASSALAWEDSDIINDGGNEIIVPLQIPKITLGSTFSIDSETPDHKGETGNVYTGKVSVAKAGQQTVMATISNYHVNEGKYKLSVWFKERNTNPKSDENPDGADNMTRMIRPEAGGQTVKQGWEYLFYVDKTSGIKHNEWTYAELEFMVDSSNNTFLNGKPTFEIKWNCADKWDSETYDSRNKNADYYISFSDFTLFKYPANELSLVKTNSGEEKCADALKFEAEFSAPIDTKSIKTVTVNGSEKDAENFEISSEGNILKISPVMGFAPNKSYDISISGFNDIFSRKYEGNVSGSVTASDYLNVEYKGVSDGKLEFNVTNNMQTNADFVIAVFYYSSNNVKKTFYSDNIEGLVSGETKTVNVSVSDDMEGFSAKAQIWNISQKIPSPLFEETVIPRTSDGSDI